MDDSNEYNDGGVRKPSLVKEVRTMPMWKWALMGVALLIAGAGVVGQRMYKAKPPQTVTVTVPAKPGSAVPGSAVPGSSGFMGGGPSTGTPAQTVTTTVAPTPTLTDQMSPYATRVGLSLFVGVVVGFISRTFVKLAATITALVIAAAVGLSYFHVLNIDMTAVKTETASASAWVEDQAGRLKTMVFSAPPSSTAAGAGFIFGFKRR